MTNPTERPEERDSLAAEIETRASQVEREGDPFIVLSLDEARTLINEVKERDEKLETTETARFLLEGAEKSARESERYWRERAAALEAEVKELREENARLAFLAESYVASGPTNPELREMAVEEHNRAAQMEEALRRAVDKRTLADDPDAGFIISKREMGYLERALSPSDTEEEA